MVKVRHVETREDVAYETHLENGGDKSPLEEEEDERGSEDGGGAGGDDGQHRKVRS